MNKFSFLYLIFSYAIASVFTLYGDISIEIQIIISLILIALFGIPHGAIDNIILLSQNRMSLKKFYLIYVAIIFIYAMIWLIFPFYSFVFFLLLSAYHFGESQLVNYKIHLIFTKVIYLLWGVFLISTLLYYNKSELINLFDSFNDTAKLNIIFKDNIVKMIYYCSNILLIFSLFYLLFTQKLKKKSFKIEFFQIILIHISFFLFPVLISFVLYFIFLHSLKVLKQEYEYLNLINNNLNIIQFVRMLLPHTLISILFLLVFFLSSISEKINISLLFFSIMSIAVITLPHSIVMSNFYNNHK